jgi:hypothetical protein
MRTFALAVAAALTAAPLLSATPASACAPPAEGEPTCSCTTYLYETDVAGHHVGVPAPTWKPQICD